MDRSRLSRGALIVGTAVVVAYLAPRWPRQQELIFDLGHLRGSVQRLEASYRRVDDAELAGGFTLDLPDRPPPTIRHALSLPNGEYLVMVSLGLAGGATGTQTSSTHRVTLTGQETTLLLENGSP